MGRCSKTLNALLECFRGDRRRCVEVRLDGARRRGEDPDPILQFIDDHKNAHAEHGAACHHLSEMEQIIPDEMQKGTTSGFEVQIVETDDPRWTAANVRYNESAIKLDNIAIDMLNVAPTTLAGLEAILKYAAQYTQDGFLWPGAGLIGDDGEEDGKSAFASHYRDWNFYLLRNLGNAVEKMVD